MCLDTAEDDIADNISLHSAHTGITNRTNKTAPCLVPGTDDVITSGVLSCERNSVFNDFILCLFNGFDRLSGYVMVQSAINNKVLYVTYPNSKRPLHCRTISHNRYRIQHSSVRVSNSENKRNGIFSPVFSTETRKQIVHNALQCPEERPLR